MSSKSGLEKTASTLKTRLFMRLKLPTVQRHHRITLKHATLSMSHSMTSKLLKKLTPRLSLSHAQNFSPSLKIV